MRIQPTQMLLQHLTPGRIAVTPFQLAVSEEMAALSAVPKSPYATFAPSLTQGLNTGAQYSAALPYIDERLANYFGQTYFGLVVLVTDARWFSATDIFAAAFDSNGVGPILGVDDNTGAGGANVHTDEDLLALWPNSPLRPLPTGTSLTVAFGRALRIGDKAGQPLEDLGVTPTEQHRITRRDLLEENADLRIRAGEILAASSRGRSRLEVATSTIDGGAVLSLTSEKIDSVDVYVNDRPVAERPVDDAGTVTVRFGSADLQQARVRVEGFTGGELTAARTVNPPINLRALAPAMPSPG